MNFLSAQMTESSITPELGAFAPAAISRFLCTFIVFNIVNEFKYYPVLMWVLPRLGQQFVKNEKKASSFSPD